MIVPKGTPIVVYKGNITIYTQSVREDEFYISSTTRDIHIIDLDLDQRLHSDLHNQIRTFCNTFGIKVGFDDLLAYEDIVLELHVMRWYFSQILCL